MAVTLAGSASSSSKIIDISVKRIEKDPLTMFIPEKN
jgi:hypothetical protein